MADFPNGEFSDPSPEERLNAEAEEFMRQGRFLDAVSRYSDLDRFSPTDLWAKLGHASALECAGRLQEAEKIMEQADNQHHNSPHLQRFRRLFFERREDYRQARRIREAMADEIGMDEGPPDQLAELFFNQGRYNEALTEFQRILREEDLDDTSLRASVLARFGACLRQGDRLDEARENLLASLGLEQGNHWTLAELAETERAAGNVDTARRFYLEALQANPEDHWCRGHLAQLEHEQGRIDEAIQLYEVILGEQPKATWALVELAQVLTDEQPDRAQELCERALEHDGTYPWAWAQLGILARNREDLDQAREHLRTALSHSPNAVWILHELADTCRQMGRLEEAHTHLEHAQNLTPFDATTYGYRANILRSEERDDEAVANLRKAVELDPGYTWAWRELAEIHALAGRAEEANEAYDQATQLEPGDAINDGLKAFLLRCDGRREEALPYLQRAVEAQPQYLWAWRELVEFLLASGRLQEALTQVEQALTQLPETAQLLALQAEVLRQLGDRDAARSAVDQALAIEQEVPQLWALRAELESDLDLDQALSLARRATALDNQPDYQVLVAQLLANGGKTGEAQDIITPLLGKDPCPVAAWHLAAELASDQNQTDTAQDHLRRGLQEHPHNVRLLMALARLELQSGQREALDHLRVCFDQQQPAPWRELAHLFAQAQDRLAARRAANRLLRQAEGDAERRAEAWTFVAELELILGDESQARSALTEALRENDAHLPAHLLAAMLTERHGKSDQAGHHLAKVDELLSDTELETHEGGQIHRQLAQIYEHRDNTDRAEAHWQHALKDRDNTDLYADFARFLLRNKRAEEALGVLEPLLERTGGSERQSVLHEMTQAHYTIGGEQAARAYLVERDQDLGRNNRLLLAQLQLSAGDNEAALAQVERILVDEPMHRPAVILRAQCLLGDHQADAAERLVRPLWRDQPKDEDAATVLGEAVALQNRWQEALDLLRHQALPRQAAPARALLIACLLLELESEEAALLWIASQSNLVDHDRPLTRVWRAAWPAWQGDGALQADDLHSLPPFPRMAQSLARALAHQGHHHVAADLLLLMAEVCERRAMPGSGRECLRQAVPYLLLCNKRRAAWRTAWCSRSIWALLRSLLP